MRQNHLRRRLDREQKIPVVVGPEMEIVAMYTVERLPVLREYLVTSLPTDLPLTIFLLAVRVE